MIKYSDKITIIIIIIIIMLTSYSIQVIIVTLFSQCIACRCLVSVTKTVHSLLPQDFHLPYEQ